MIDTTTYCAKQESVFSRVKNWVKRLIAKHKKSEVLSWAEREIKIASDHERKVSENQMEWDYGCACYDNALEAFRCLIGKGHSGYSITVVQNALNRLIDRKPLTPIEDVPDVWSEIVDRCEEERYTCYQCKRMSSLFKYVYDNGRVKYYDVDRVKCIDIENGGTYSSGIVSRVVDEMFPISMPYMPLSKPFKAYCSDILTDEKNGDFDTKAIFHVIKPDEEKVEINRFFKEGPGSKWVEILSDEYAQREKMHEQRMGAKPKEEVKKSKIIAVDFDGTLFENKFPEIGEPIFETISLLKKEIENGAKVILWTNRIGLPLKKAIAECEFYDIHFDAINDNIPEIKEAWRVESRKIFANEYWDDRAISLPHLTHPDKENV